MKGGGPLEPASPLLRGDIDGYLALIEHSKDYPLMNPFGGAPTHGFVDSPECRAAMAKFFDALMASTCRNQRATRFQLAKRGSPFF